MIAHAKPYPVMKDSGVTELGTIPEHWDAVRLGRIGQLFKGNGGSKEDEVASGMPCVRYGDLYTRHEFFIESARGALALERADAYTPIQHGDLLFAASGETIEEIGKSAVNLIHGDVRCGGDVLVLRPSIEYDTRFLGYAADAMPARVQKARMGRGFTVVHLYGSQLKQLALAIPTPGEQAAIARFVDHARAQICYYIRAKQQLVKLLEEQKQAIIHQAVTRGLDPSVPFKPSGMERPAEVPAHWGVLALKHVLIRLVDCEHKTAPAVDDSRHRVVRTSAVRHGRLRLEGTYYTTEAGFREWTQRAVPAPGDVIFTREAPAGEACVVPEDLHLCLGQRTVLMQVRRDQYEPEFLVHMIYAGPPKDRIVLASQGSTVGHFNMDDIGWMQILQPPVAEQRAILDDIRRRTAGIEQAKLRADAEISLLGEYRTRLIADVVTGKLDVRDAAARLPEELEPLDEHDPGFEAGAPDEDLDAELEEAVG